MPTLVSARYLLEGAVYAVEQCGLLLADANTLYRNGSYASAVAVALFAREELGRYQILLELRKTAVAGDSVTIEDIQDRCRHHVAKQEAGMLSFVLRLVTDSELGKLFNIRSQAKPGSDEWKMASERIEKLDHQQRRQIPLERHQQRMSALYVDAVTPDHWNRPVREISQISAYEHLQDVANEYSNYHDRYTNLEIHKADDPELYSALQSWTGRPELPLPERPAFSTPPWLNFQIAGR